MAIMVRCMRCKTDQKLGAKKCRNCGASFNTQGNRKYRVLVSRGHKRYSKIVTNLSVARELETKWKKKLDERQYDLYADRKGITLGQLWERYLSWAQENRSSWRDIANVYKNHLSHLEKYDLRDIQPWHIEKIAHKMRKAGRAPATIRKVINIFSGIFTKAKQWNIYHGHNPCRQVEKPKVNNEIVRYLTPEQEASLFAVLNEWHDIVEAGIIKLLLFTGMRRGEVLKLKWSDVDIVKETVLIRDPKGKKDVRIPLSRLAVETLKQLPRQSEYIFPGRKGGHRKEIKGLWGKIKEQAGLPKEFRLHDLRHHYATTLVTHGADIYTVSKLLSHKDIKTTQRYAHLADKTLRNGVSRLDEAMGQSIKVNTNEAKIVKLRKSHKGGSNG